jgi:hypothetical protein
VGTVIEALPDEPFAAAVARLVELYREGAELAESASDAEALLAAGMRLGDQVRRRNRGRPRGATVTPSPEEVTAVEELAARLARIVAAARTAPAVAELRTSIAAGDMTRSAEVATRVFVGLAAEPTPPHLYRPLAIRRRVRGAGETLPDPDALVAELVAIASDGIGAPRERTGVPEPIVLSPSWDASGAELALRIRGAELGPLLLHHQPSGDRWLFAPRLAGRFDVCLARTAEDEWWAASPIPYAMYAERVAAQLAARGMRCERMG